MRDQVLHVGPLRGVFLAPAEHRLQALGPIQLLRLRLDEPVDLLVAVVGVVAGRAALVVLEEIRVRIVDDSGGEVGADLELAPGQGRKPRG